MNIFVCCNVYGVISYVYNAQDVLQMKSGNLSSFVNLFHVCFVTDNTHF